MSTLSGMRMDPTNTNPSESSMVRTTNSKVYFFIGGRGTKNPGRMPG